MRLDAGRLREERERRGLSLGGLAGLIGVSRRSIYEYERSGMDIVLDKALRILDVLGEDVFQPIDVFRVEEPRSEVENVDEEGEKRLAKELLGAGGVVVHAKRTVVDLAARLGDRASLIVYEHRGEDARMVLRRGEEAARVARVTSSEAIAVVESREAARELEAMGFEVVRGAEEAARRIRESRLGEPSGEA